MNQFYFRQAPNDLRKSRRSAGIPACGAWTLLACTVPQAHVGAEKTRSGSLTRPVLSLSKDQVHIIPVFLRDALLARFLGRRLLLHLNTI